MSDGQDKRLLYVASAAILTVATAGMITGTRPPVSGASPSGGSQVKGASEARSYSDLREDRYGPNAGMYDDAFSWIRSLGPGLTDPVNQSEEDRARAISARAQRRAYAGAPPVVPHPIQEREAAACLACHEEGAVVGGLIAPMMSHQKYTMCVQCHAPARPEAQMVAQLGPVGGENLFTGTVEPGVGNTAWDGAPPTIPHPTMMRENCSSCHGRLGAHGLRSTHPVRANCTQCHAAAETFDQAAPPTLPPPLGAP